MNIREELKALKECGITLKLISSLSDVPLETVYNISRDRIKNIPAETQTALEKAITKAKEILR